MSESTTFADDSRSAAVAAVSDLLMGELAAVETYTRAIGAAREPGVVEHLQRIRDDHRRAERGLRGCLAELNGRVDVPPAPWGPVAALTSQPEAAPVAPLLAALCQGEEQALGTYQHALHGDDLYPDCRRAICADLLPTGRRHIDDLNRLLAGGS